MQRCRPKATVHYQAIQWTGKNVKELVEAIGDVAKLSASPYSEDQITIQGGDSYLIVEPGQWILKSDHEVMIVDEASFKNNFEMLD